MARARTRERQLVRAGGQRIRVMSTSVAMVARRGARERADECEEEAAAVAAAAAATAATAATAAVAAVAVAVAAAATATTTRARGRLFCVAALSRLSKIYLRPLQFRRHCTRLSVGGLVGRARAHARGKGGCRDYCIIIICRRRRRRSHQVEPRPMCNRSAHVTLANC